MTSPLTAIEEASTGDAQAIIDAAERAAGFTPMPEDGRFYGAITADGKVHVVDLEDHLDDHRARPRRKRGTYAVHDARSFVEYLAKHSLPETEVWADVPASKVTAIVNSHTANEDEAGWEDHTLTYRVATTPAWDAWSKYDGKLISQTVFAELIEDRAIDIASPAAADMLELAETFQATVGVNFESSKALSSGERQFEYRETIDAKAGKAGRLEVPKEFVLGLVPFEGAAPYKVTARFRYRITDGNLLVGYKLERPEDVLRTAFLDVVDQIGTGIEAPIYRGSR